MGRLKELIRESEATLHERRMEFRSYPAPDRGLIVEGWLRDERLAPGYHWNGDDYPTGVIHWMCVRVLVGGWPPVIQEAEAEMPEIPHELCPSTLDSVDKLVGLRVASGFSEEVKTRLGGVNGCTHLTALAVAMGPAIIHGYWTQMYRERRQIPKSLEDIPGFSALINSCRLWRDDGPLMARLKTIMTGSQTCPE